jgi:hypothetical protein
LPFIITHSVGSGMTTLGIGIQFYSRDRNIHQNDLKCDCECLCNYCLQ